MSQNNTKSEGVGDNESFVLRDSINRSDTGGKGRGEENDQGHASDDSDPETHSFLLTLVVKINVRISNFSGRLDGSLIASMIPPRL
jgi:hypothetical protein